jgi:enoyl-CoA hydratase/carnithine racemase
MPSCATRSANGNATAAVLIIAGAGKAFCAGQDRRRAMVA